MAGSVCSAIRSSSFYGCPTNNNNGNNSNSAAAAGNVDVRSVPQRLMLNNLNLDLVRLSMMNRDFDANDYEMLCKLDEQSEPTALSGNRKRAIQALPTFVQKV
jgi:hypothetical protein